MQATFMIPCQFADQLSGGGPIIVGVFREIRRPYFPAKLDPFFIALEIEADPDEADREYQLLLRLVDEDGRTVYENTIELEMRRRPDMLASYVYAPLLIKIENPIPQSGAYRFDLLLGDETIAQSRIEFRLA